MEENKITTVKKCECLELGKGSFVLGHPLLQVSQLFIKNIFPNRFSMNELAKSQLCQ